MRLIPHLFVHFRVLYNLLLEATVSVPSNLRVQANASLVAPSTSSTHPPASAEPNQSGTPAVRRPPRPVPAL